MIVDSTFVYGWCRIALLDLCDDFFENIRATSSKCSCEWSVFGVLIKKKQKKNDWFVIFLTYNFYRVSSEIFVRNSHKSRETFIFLMQCSVRVFQEDFFRIEIRTKIAVDVQLFCDRENPSRIVSCHVVCRDCMYPNGISSNQREKKRYVKKAPREISTFLRRTIIRFAQIAASQRGITNAPLFPRGFVTESSIVVVVTCDRMQEKSVSVARPGKPLTNETKNRAQRTLLVKLGSYYPSDNWMGNADRSDFVRKTETFARKRFAFYKRADLLWFLLVDESAPVLSCNFCSRIITKLPHEEN